jgi:hypothetical protein
MEGRNSSHLFFLHLLFYAVKNALKSLRRRTQAGLSRSNVDGTSADHTAEWATLDMNHSNTMDIHSDQDHSHNDSNLSRSVISQSEEVNDKQSSLAAAMDTSAAPNSVQTSNAPSMTESWSTLGTVAQTVSFRHQLILPVKNVRINSHVIAT